MDITRFASAAVLVSLAGSASSALGQLDTPFPAAFELSDLLPSMGGDGSLGFVMNGNNEYDYSGFAVSSAGDVNGDGVDDILIGAPFTDAPYSDNVGQVYVVFGDSAGFNASIELASLDGTDGFVIEGVGSYDRSGLSVSSAGDIDGDGVDDILIGGYSDSSYDVSYVVFGRDTAVQGDFAASVALSSLNGSNGFVINGDSEVITFGAYASVSAAGDVNGDGVDDILIGAHTAYTAGIGYTGQSYVVFGRDTAMTGSFGASFELSSLDGMNGFAMSGAQVYGGTGFLGVLGG